MSYSLKLKTEVVKVTEAAHGFCDRCERTQPIGDDMVYLTAGPRKADICLRCIGVLVTRKAHIRLKAPADPVEELRGTALLRRSATVRRNNTWKGVKS